MADLRDFIWKGSISLISDYEKTMVRPEWKQNGGRLTWRKLQKRFVILLRLLLDEVLVKIRITLSCTLRVHMYTLTVQLVSCRNTSTRI